MLGASAGETLAPIVSVSFKPGATVQFGSRTLFRQTHLHLPAGSSVLLKDKKVPGGVNPHTGPVSSTWLRPMAGVWNAAQGF